MFIPLCFLAYGVFWWLLALQPLSRSDWLLENVLTLLGVGLLVGGCRRGVFSTLSVTLALLFLSLHTVGAHYTYSAVPYDAWAEQLFGQSIAAPFGWHRNQFDRFVHFAFGALLALPLREWLIAAYQTPSRNAGRLTLLLVMAASMLYELIEWAAALAFGVDLGTAYVGAQGDPWDAQKDMALASTGALVANAIFAVRQRPERVNRAVRRGSECRWDPGAL